MADVSAALAAFLDLAAVTDASTSSSIDRITATEAPVTSIDRSMLNEA